MTEFRIRLRLMHPELKQYLRTSLYQDIDKMEIIISKCNLHYNLSADEAALRFIPEPYYWEEYLERVKND